MKASDFRIGNLIIDFEGEVSPIGAGDLLGMVQCEIANHPVDFIKPIPLTKQHLYDFGFDQNKDWQNTWLWKNGFGVNFHNEKWSWNDLSQNRQLDYVHQLQNLFFALTCEELSVSPQ